MALTDKTYIYRGDDTRSFGQNLLQIECEGIPTGYTISRAELKIGSLPLLTFSNPTFPLLVNLDPDQTRLLQQNTPCYLAVYDQYGYKQTCQGSITIDVKGEVVSDV